MSEPPVPAPAVTLKEMAVWLRAPEFETREPEATMLQEALDAAIERVEDDCGPIAQATIVCHPRPRRHKLVLPHTRLLAITEILDPDGNVIEPYDADPLTGIIELAAAPPTAKRWTVTVTPRDAAKSLTLAVKIIASHLFDVNRGRGAIPAQTAYTSGDPDRASASGFALPRRAEQLMQPYRKAPR